MTKIGVISDTHDNQQTIKNAMSLFIEEKVGVIFHSGDFIAPFSIKALLEANIPLRLCFGNNDGEKRIIRQILGQQENCRLEEIILIDEVQGKKIAMTHGHFPNVLKIALNSGTFDIVISGHNHQKKCEKLPNGTLHINPGEGGGWLSNSPSIAVIDLKSMETNFLEL